jgi:hypothetical protein
MKKFVVLNDKQCFVFLAENDTQAKKYAETISNTKEEIIVREIEGINVQHEIAFELCKSLKDLTFQEAEKSGIKPK